MARNSDPVPAIARNFSDADRAVPVFTTRQDTVSFVRGLGDSGKRIEQVGCECPECGSQRMVRLWRVRPTDRDVVKYWCQDPWCKYWVGDQFSYTKRHPTAPEPEPAISFPERNR